MAIAFETVELADGSLPLLIPMSEVAGRMSIQVGAAFLEKPHQGKGVLLGGVPGVPPAHVVIIGGGTVGTSALKRAIGMGVRVTVIDANSQTQAALPGRCFSTARSKPWASNRFNIAASISGADLLIGGVLVHGPRAPKLVTADMVSSMEKGSVIVDVAIDQGGCIWTIDHCTTHHDPVYIKYDVVHYAVANMPGAVARTFYPRPDQRYSALCPGLG